jgi:hypothetical protein
LLLLGGPISERGTSLTQDTLLKEPRANSTFMNNVAKEFGNLYAETI